MNGQLMFPREPEQRPKWFNSRVTCHEGTLKEIEQYIPDFDRQEFSLAVRSNQRSRANPRLDMIVRKPFGEDHEFIPIGIVSKDYILIKHFEVLKAAKQSVENIKISAQDIRAKVELTEYGERMALSLYLPEELAFDPGDGNQMAMRLEIFNSVEGSTRFRVLMGWFRFVCSNGLVIGVTQANISNRHIGDLNLNDVSEVLSLGLEVAKTEKENFRKWRRQPVSIAAIARWVEKDVKKQWGFKAATRVFHIARTGYDVEIRGQYKDRTPTTIETRKTLRVPGSPTQTESLFDLSQTLAWVAKERRDIQEQLEWREQIPAILEPLMVRFLIRDGNSKYG